ncbi:hypothetical protein ACWKSP_28765 [Micromonosporaceae bacterium Da 78-11]
MLRQVAGATAGSGGVISALLAGGWTGVVLLAAVVVVLVAATCWVIADADRPARLALLITAWRGRTPARARRVAAATKPRKPRPVLNRGRTTAVSRRSS